MSQNKDRQLQSPTDHFTDRQIDQLAVESEIDSQTDQIGSEQQEVDSDAEQSDQLDEGDTITVQMPEPTREEVEAEPEPKPKGRPKGSKTTRIEAEEPPSQSKARARKIHVPNPEFNRETRQQTHQQSKPDSNLNTAFYTTYVAGPESLIYNDP